MDISEPLIFLTIAGLLAGFIDAIAGGGGLITIPVLAAFLGAGPHAIGTNKIAGLFAAFVALMVYWRDGHIDIRRSMIFTLWIMVGAFGGSSAAPLLPVSVFRWILVVTCPIILYVIWNKDLWIQKEASSYLNTKKRRNFIERLGVFEPGILVSGILCGFYDGVWGPGGGTFMFLSLLFFGKLPLLVALAASKLANTCSALVSLVNYQIGGYVHWKEGMFIAVGCIMGAFVGARYATKAAARIVRPVLAIVVTILILRLIR